MDEVCEPFRAGSFGIVMSKDAECDGYQDCQRYCGQMDDGLVGYVW